MKIKRLLSPNWYGGTSRPLKAASALHMTNFKESTPCYGMLKPKIPSNDGEEVVPIEDLDIRRTHDLDMPSFV
jgi:hypothetical protein